MHILIFIKDNRKCIFFFLEHFFESKQIYGWHNVRIVLFEYHIVEKSIEWQFGILSYPKITFCVCWVSNFWWQHANFFAIANSDLMWRYAVFRSLNKFFKQKRSYVRNKSNWQDTFITMCSIFAASKLSLQLLLFYIQLIRLNKLLSSFCYFDEISLWRFDLFNRYQKLHKCSY